MNTANFTISITDAIKFLKEHSLFKSKGVKPLGNHSDEFKKICRKNRHTEIFSTATENKDYEILLFDDSIFQFSLENGALRYAFIQNPNLFVSRDEYLSSLYSPEDLLELSDDELDDLKKSISENEYEQFFNEQDLNLSSHIIRYDLNINGYAPLIHSYSHIHIGLNDNLRIPCSKILTPFKFVLFAIKHTYYSEWKNAFIKDTSLENKINESKTKCDDIPNTYWTDKEKFELYLH